MSFTMIATPVSLGLFLYAIWLFFQGVRTNETGSKWKILMAVGIVLFLIAELAILMKFITRSI